MDEKLQEVLEKKLEELVALGRKNKNVLDKKDIDQINAIYLDGLTFHYVRTIKDVLDLALV